MWIGLTFASLVMWSLMNVIDSYFIEDVYRDEYDGLIISALFNLLPFLGIFFVKDFSLMTIVMSSGAGFLMMLSFLFYLKAFKYHNDPSAIQIAWLLSAPVVLILSFIFLSEKLDWVKYVGMAVIFFGGIVFSFFGHRINKKMSRLIPIMVPAIILYALCTVMMRWVYEVREVNFFDGFIWFCFGGAMLGIGTCIARRKTVTKKYFFPVVRKYWKIFLAAELVELVAVFFQQTAIEKTTNVALFATLESFMPIMVIIVMLATIVFLRMVGNKKEKEIISDIYENNMLAGLKWKIAIVVLMAYGTYLIG